ncbi:hypothetical protein HMPREF1546_00642 [Oscillibacter sp. KLE 1745]|nr:hypothetical protein HMPREF1546_00642 [Oscillibacter sp. KLE 1745]
MSLRSQRVPKPIAPVHAQNLQSTKQWKGPCQRYLVPQVS